MLSSDINNSQRETGFRACIPFFILYDLDLNANHIRLYGQIEQMESNPNPNVQATFSYAWIANLLGISRRNAITIANKLKEKGYIEHIEIAPNKWLWRTAKKPIIQAGSDLQDHPGGDLQDHSPSDPQDHPKIPEIKSHNLKEKINKKKKSSLDELIELVDTDNPHHISRELIEEWHAYRKKPVTNRVWKKTNQVLEELNAQGITPLKAFEHMLEKQWQGIETEYFDNKISPRNDKQQSRRPMTLAEVLAA